jgi:hypothetical protein
LRFKGGLTLKKLLVFIVVFIFLGVNAFGEDIYIDGDGNLQTGISNNMGNLKVTGASGEHGLVGEASGTGAAGVYGKAGTGINDDFGTLGEFDGFNYYGVHGKSSTGFAGYFEGDAKITGNLTVDGSITGETDPTVNANVKDGVDWTELTGIPGGFADGIDNTGGSDIWTQNGPDISYMTGNVGIGTSTPAGKLDISGDICLGGVCRTTWPTGSGSGAFTDTGTTAYYTGGNVGIGTVSPQGLQNVDSRVLHIFHTPAATGDSAVGLRLELENNIDAGIMSAYRAGATSGLFVGTLNNYRVGLGTNSVEQVTISTDGYLGIGTPTPLQPLHVQGNAYVFGNLGIGVDSPSHALQVNGTNASFSSGSGDFRLSISKNTDTDIASLLFQNSHTGRAELGLTGDNNFHIKVSEDGLTFSDAFVIDSTNGNIGIGTMSTYNKINVISDSMSAIWAEGTDTSTLPVIDARNFGTGHAVRIGHFGPTGIGLLIAHNSSDPALVIRGGGADLFTVESTGDVGIGTATPQSALQVTGYTQLALTSGAPPAADCDTAEERGRMKVDNVNGLLYICVDSGWVAK